MYFRGFSNIFFTFLVAKYEEKTRKNNLKQWKEHNIANPENRKPWVKNNIAPFYPKNNHTGFLCFFRGVFGSIGITLYYISASLMPIQTFSVIGRLNIFMVILVGAVVYKTKIDSKKLLACLIAFVGVWILLQPEFFRSIF
jgi:drug/metabolite transporter (DMT)-like permease